MMKSWRGRYLNRMVTSLSKSHAEKSGAKARLFPYGIVDSIAAAKKTPLTAAAPKPISAKPTEASAPSKQTSWHFIKK